MSRIRTWFAAAIISTSVLAGSAIAADRPRSDSAAPNNPPASTSPERQSTLRRLWNNFKGHGTYPKTRDWTTGRDDAAMKPWLKR